MSSLQWEPLIELLQSEARKQGEPSATCRRSSSVSSCRLSSASCTWMLLRGLMAVEGVASSYLYLLSCLAGLLSLPLVEDRFSLVSYWRESA